MNANILNCLNKIKLAKIIMLIILTFACSLQAKEKFQNNLISFGEVSLSQKSRQVKQLTVRNTSENVKEYMSQVYFPPLQCKLKEQFVVEIPKVINVPGKQSVLLPVVLTITNSAQHLSEADSKCIGEILLFSDNSPAVKWELNITFL